MTSRGMAFRLDGKNALVYRFRARLTFRAARDYCRGLLAEAGANCGMPMARGILTRERMAKQFPQCGKRKTFTFPEIWRTEGMHPNF